MTEPAVSGRLIYVTYASGAFLRNLRVNAWFARHGLGADELRLCTRQTLEADPIYQAHHDVFDAPRGDGYWAWKPLMILRALETAGPEDIVIYQDCGAGWRYRSMLRPRQLERLARREGFLAGVLAPQHGPNRQWNRKACLTLMGMNQPEWLNSPQVEACLSLWPGTDQSRGFVARWLAWCLKLEAIRDANLGEQINEDSEFIEHRHDQAILTNLCLKEGAPVLEPQQASLPFAKSLTMLELDLRGRGSAAWRAVYRTVSGLGSIRRRLRG